MDQLLTMVFAQLTSRTSLRETVTCLRALGPRCYHCGIRTTPARSTLAEANERRDHRIFMDTALVMITAARLELPADVDLRRLRADAYAIDSTTIDLCLKLFPWAHFRRRKAGIQSPHDARPADWNPRVYAGFPCQNTRPLGARPDRSTSWRVLRHDKGYVDFARLYRLHQAGAFFITRAKSNMDFGIPPTSPRDTRPACESDWLVRLRGPKSRMLYPDTLRRVRYVGPGRRQTTDVPHQSPHPRPRTIALLYRKRWRIELFFKWIQATPAHQGLLWHHPRGREDPAVDRGDHVRHGEPTEAPFTGCLRP